mmetsp:Transcript_66982/g.179064  ORF Transcript_66982/g.179064 Transcript_66982/m.179064 type:complete len:150 (-) Transcript_66982:87-536(-)
MCFHRASVLLVDDDRASVLVVKRMIERAGFQCDVADNGEDAVRAATKKTYCAVIMDYIMPGMTGCDAAMRIKDLDKQHSVAEIVGMVSSEETSIREQCVEAGMTSVLRKPIDRSALSTLLRNASIKSLVPPEKKFNASELVQAKSISQS